MRKHAALGEVICCAVSNIYHPEARLDPVLRNFGGLRGFGVEGFRGLGLRGFAVKGLAKGVVPALHTFSGCIRVTKGLFGRKLGLHRVVARARRALTFVISKVY